jgi:hypothetical protein
LQPIALQVHRFTLLDIHARGYVRPFAMSFITRDPYKIMNNFAKLLTEFTKVPVYSSFHPAVILSIEVTVSICW